MLLTRSWWLRALAVVVAAAAFFATYEVTIQKSEKKDPNAPPAPGERFTISATAYCKGSITAAGVAVQNGAAASDKSLLPLGSIIHVQTGDARYDGMYTILDTGPEIKGHEVDIYMWSCHEALDFGRRDVKATLLRRGWDPRATAPPRANLIERLLGREPRAQPVLEAGRPPSARPTAPRRSGVAPPDTPPAQPEPETPAAAGAGPSSPQEPEHAPANEAPAPAPAETRPPAP